MSRLDSVIRRLEAQRSCLDLAAEMIQGHEGVVLELGLGNGRTYDHLRERLPDREIYVFERELQPHPDCVPPEDRLILGDIRETLSAAVGQLSRRAILVHADIGTGDEERNRQFAAWLGLALVPLLADDAIVLCDQELPALQEYSMPVPEGIQPDRYFIYQFK